MKRVEDYNKYFILIIFIILLTLIFSTFATSVDISYEKRFEDIKLVAKNLEFEGNQISRINYEILKVEENIKLGNNTLIESSLDKAEILVSAALECKELYLLINEVNDFKNNNKDISNNLDNNISIENNISNSLILVKNEMFLENYQGCINQLEIIKVETVKLLKDYYNNLFQIIDEAYEFETENNLKKNSKEYKINLNTEIQNLNTFQIKNNEIKIISLNKSIIGIENIISSIQDRMSINASHKRYDDILKECFIQYNKQNFELLNNIIAEFEELEKTRENVNLRIINIEEKIIYLKEKNLEYLGFEEKLSLVKKEYQLENFILAKDLAEPLLNDILYAQSTGIFNSLTNEFDQNPLINKILSFISWSILIILIIIVTFFKRVIFIINQHRIRLLFKDIKNIENLINKNQQRYYKKKAIPKKTYIYLRDKYESKLVGTKEKLILLRKKV